MKNDPKRKNTKKANSRKWKAHWKKIVSTLAAVTVFCTTYALILPAITVNSNTYCGLEEHEHTEACYTKELICGLTEGEIPGAEGGQADTEAPQTETQIVTETVTETVIEIQQVLVDEGHVHQDSCYEETRNLVCGLEEVEPKEAVLDEDGNVVEEAEEGHTHTDECYQVERVLVCTEEEREPVYEEKEVEVEKEVVVEKEVEVPVEQPAQPAQPAGEPHVHTDACYKEVLTCGKEEHKHVDECFSNPTLDLETAADWEKTLPKEDELTENWAEDVLTIAKSQLGYKESSRNFKAVNGDRKGYTRYGARFGAPYSDWCAMFIQFAMHYAGVDERLMPGNPSVSKWIENVKKIENYFEPADYTPVPGDIMFIDWDKVVEGVERDGDHIGIVAEVKTTEETTPDGAKLEVPTSIVTIEGNLDNEVKYNTYKIDDERILGYSHMPEKPETEEELEKRVKEIEALIEGKELVEGEEGAEGEEPAEGTEEENEEIVVDTIIALASYTESGVQVNFEAPSSVFPEGTVDPALNVVEILPGTPEYDEYFAQAQANAGTEVLNARFFDISVVDLEGNEIKLNDESLAKVEIIFPENETMTTEGNIDVLHFAEEGLEVLESQVQGREEVEAITFDTTSFSPYGVVQTPRSGEGSTKPALAEKREKSDGPGFEYVVTSWEALEKLIESGTYKDTDGSEKTDDMTLTSIDVVIDGVIGANSTIDTNGKEIKLNGQNGASVYVCSTATSLSGGMFKVDGGSMEIKNVTFSGQKATYQAGSSIGWTNSGITVSDGKLSIGGKKLGRNSSRNGFEAGDTVSYPLTIDGSTSGDFRIRDDDYTYYGVGSGGVVRFNENNPTDDEFKWYLSGGVLVNKKYPSCALHMDDSGNVTLATKENGGGGSSVDSWTAPAANSNDNINNLVNASTQGFFITAENGAKVTIKDNTSFQDMIYTGTESTVSPIYVTGTGTELEMDSETAVIKNNRSYIPARSDDFVSKDRWLLYEDVIDKADRANDPKWDLNPGGNTDRKAHDDGTKAAGGIFITDSGTVNLKKGTIGGDNAGNTGIAGAVYIDGGTLNQSGGSIKGNHAFKGAVVVDGVTSTYNLTTGSVTENDSTMHGGGISALNEGTVIVGKEGQNCDTNDVPVISYNRTLDQGGGIYVHSDNVKLRRARIEHNAAHFMGGGIYVYGGDSKQDDKNSVLILDDTYVTRNYAGNQAFIDGEEGFGFDNSSWGGGQTYGEGGGIWSCTYGSFIMNANEIHIWKNDAHSPGKDFYKHAKGNASGVITEFIANTDNNTYYDTKETNDTTDDTFYDVRNFSPVTGRLSLINKGPESKYDAEMEGLCDAVKITDNRAGYAGGGIGSNGIISYKPLEEQDVYRPELIFSKSFRNKGSDSNDISTEGKSATFNVTVTNLINPNEEPAVYTGIVLQDGAKYVDDPNGVDPKGYSIDNWTATITLPQMFTSDRKSIYQAIIDKNADPSMNHSQGYYNIDDMIKIVIEEVDMTGDAIKTYDLRLTEMTYSYNGTPFTNYQNDVTITYHDIELETSLINEKKNGHGQVQITKKDASDGAELTHEDFEFKYRKVTKSGSNYNPIDGEDWVAFTQSGAVHTSAILDSDSYYEIQESNTENGYTGLGASVYIYVDLLGKVSIDSKNGMGDFIKDEATTTLVVDGDESIVGQVLTFTVYNKPETGLDIVKVSNMKDAQGNPIAVTGGTTFQIKNFNFGKTNNSMASPVTITLDENNSFRITDIIEAFKGTGPNGKDLTESQIVNSKFYIQETQTHENGRYNGLQHVIPFTITKNTHGAYVFTPLTKAEVEAHENAKDSSGTSFYEAGKVRSVINFNDSDKAVYVEWADASGTKIKDVEIDSAKGSVKYTVTNEMKPIEIKVAKLDENGNPKLDANTSFSLRPAKRNGKGLYGTHSDPEDGVLTYNNQSPKISGGITLEPGKAYALWEEQAPAGYELLGLSVIVEVDQHGVVSLVSSEDELKNTSKYDLDAPAETVDEKAKLIAEAISNGTISLSDTVDENGVVTINIMNYPTEDLEVQKVWVDNDDKAGKRPSSITVDLYANYGDGNGSVKVDGETLTLTSNKTVVKEYGKSATQSNAAAPDDWSGKWTKLPSYKNGVRIAYSVKESETSGYISNITYEAGKPATESVDCSNAGTGAFQGWRAISPDELENATDGFRIRAGSLFFYVQDNGGLATAYTSRANSSTSEFFTDGKPQTKILWKANDITSYYNPNNGYTYYMFSLKNVGKNKYFDSNGSSSMDLVASSSPARFGYVASRLYYDQKYWYGNSSYYRYVNGSLTTKGSYSVSDNIMPTVFEVPVYEQSTGCDPIVVPATPGKYTIINTWKDVVELDVEKHWDDNNNFAGHRPPSIEVHLHKNGTVIDTQTLSADNSWKYTWTDLTKYDANDQPYTYSVSEGTIEYYTLDGSNSVQSISANNISSGGTVVESWSDLSYSQLQNATDGFRIVVDNYVYYLDTTNPNNPVLRSAHISSDLPEFKDARSVWVIKKYTPLSNGHIQMTFQSKWNSEYYISTENSYLKAKKTNSPTVFDYNTYDGEIKWYNSTSDMGWWTATPETNNCRARFVKTEKANWKESGSLKLTNKYQEHTGLELVKVDENGKSDQWVEEDGKQAQFTIYHMKGEIAPKTITIENGKKFLDPIPTELIPTSGNSYFFIVETRTPTQENKPAYLKLETAIPIRISSSGEAYLITSASDFNGTWFQNNYNSETKILPAAGSGNNARPAVKVDFGLIGDGKTVSASKDDKRLVITAKNTPINNELELLKIDNLPSEGKVDGAEFSIKNESTESYVSPAEGGWWTTSDGKWKVSNLAPGTYTIKEESAPKSYVKSNATVTVVVDEYTGKITVTPSDTNVVVGVTGSGTTSVSFKFINQISSYELPQAGGIGTTILYIAGAILVIGAGVLLIVRKKMNK